MSNGTAIVVALAYALAGAAPSEGLVLCIAPGEHIAVERASQIGASCDGCVDDAHAPASRTQSVSYVLGDGSCPCIDVPLPEIATGARAQCSKLPCVAEATSVPAAAVLPLSGARHSIAGARASFPAHSALAPRASVLRI